MEFKKLEQKAKEIRGDGPVLGRNVLAVGFETSFPGTNRPSTIKGSGQPPPEEPLADMKGPSATALKTKPKLDISQATAAWGGQFIHGISAPMEQLEAQFAEQLREQHEKETVTKMEQLERESMAQASDQLMEAANKGVIIVPKEETKPPTTDKIDPTRFRRTAMKKSTGRRKK
jgi:hypothetical protein